VSQKSAGACGESISAHSGKAVELRDYQARSMVAFASSGRSDRLPDSTSVNSPSNSQLPLEIAKDDLALCQ
jgi:hypothetical protein